MRELKLTRGLFALVDDEDYEWLSSSKWRAHGSDGRHIYGASGVHPNLVLLHREIVGARPGEKVDHANGNTLDNRRCNLRKCSASENQANVRVVLAKSGFKGVHVASGRPGLWRVSITVNQRDRYLGCFTCPVQAALAYDEEAVRLFGEFAATNESLGLFSEVTSI